MVRTEKFEDDPEIADDEIVYRRIDWEKAGGPGRYAVGAILPPKPNHFSDYPDDRARELGYPSGCMSVGLRSVLLEHGHAVETLLEGPVEYGIAAIRVGDLRTLKNGSGDPCPQGIMAAPTPDEPWHAVVFDLSGGRRSSAAQKAISKAATIAVELVRR